MHAYIYAHTRAHEAKEPCTCINVNMCIHTIDLWLARFGLEITGPAFVFANGSGSCRGLSRRGSNPCAGETVRTEHTSQFAVRRAQPMCQLRGPCSQYTKLFTGHTYVLWSRPRRTRAGHTSVLVLGVRPWRSVTLVLIQRRALPMCQLVSSLK